MSKIYLSMKKIVRKNQYVYRAVKGIQMLVLGAQSEYIVLSDKKLVYLNNSKVACSSIKSTFLDKDIKDDYSIHNAMKKRKKRLNKNEKNYYIFTFVRNPYERLVSCYESKYHTDRNNKGEKANEKLWFSNYLFGYIKKDRGFEAFIDDISKIPNRIADSHFRSQYDLIYGRRNRVKMDFIGHYENIDIEYARIVDEFGLIELPHFNASGSKDYRTYYTKETAEKVYRRFQKDFDAFGYTWAYDDLMSWLGKSEGNEIEI